MQVVGLNAKLGWDALHVGYFYLVLAVLMLCQNMWITPRLQKQFGAVALAVVGTLAHGLLTFCAFALSTGTFSCVTCLLIANVGYGTRNATSGTITVRFADDTNRGAVFGQIQMWTNFGRMLGPLIAGSLAVKDPLTLPWAASGLCTLLSAVALVMLRIPPDRQPVPLRTPMLQEHFSDLEGLNPSMPLEQEIGTRADYERLGQHVGDLLTRRNYRWVSKQEGVFLMLDRLLPELRVTGNEQLQDLEEIVKRAREAERSLNKLAGRNSVS